MACPDDGYRTVPADRYAGATADPLVGTVFLGRYRIEERVGRGGMGTVYRADQLAVGRPVAVKLLHGRLMDDLKEVARFQREARAIAAMKHPNAIRLIDFGETDGGASLFIVTEFLEGEPLSALIAREAPLAPARVVAMADQVLQVLVEAHALGIVHRDLKPQNLFVTHVVDQEFVKVLDFGIAKLVAALGAETTLTATGVAIGSPRYMAPEQARAQPVSGQADLYALGCVLYELLCGVPPFERGTASEYVVAHVKEDALPPRVAGRALAGPLVDLLMQCLEKRPEDRPAGAAGMLARLRALGPELLDAAPPPPRRGAEGIAATRALPPVRPGAPAAPPAGRQTRTLPPLPAAVSAPLPAAAPARAATAAPDPRTTRPLAAGERPDGGAPTVDDADDPDDAGHAGPGEPDDDALPATWQLDREAFAQYESRHLGAQARAGAPPDDGAAAPPAAADDDADDGDDGDPGGVAPTEVVRQDTFDAALAQRQAELAAQAAPPTGAAPGAARPSVDRQAPAELPQSFPKLASEIYHRARYQAEERRRLAEAAATDQQARRRAQATRRLVWLGVGAGVIGLTALILALAL